jgi:AcrR family transcriptional regulator
LYVRLGLLPEPQKTAGGRSLYGERHVDLIRRIGEWKQQGYQLSDIKTLLDEDTARLGDDDVDLVALRTQSMHRAIIEVATEEFLRQGYERTHVSSIIQRLGINPQVFYAHFPSKLQLLAECYHNFIRQSVARTEAELETHHDPGERAIRRLASDHEAQQFGELMSGAIRSDGGLDHLEEFNIADTLELIMDRIVEDIERVRGLGSDQLPVPDELLAYGLMGAHRFQRMRTSWGRGLTTADYLRAHLFFYLAILAAASGEVDIYSRLERYEDIIAELSARMPEIPPMV